MIAVRNIFILFFLIGVFSISLPTFYSEDQIPENQKYTKEYFYEQQMKIESNPFLKAIHEALNQAASIFSLHDEKILLPVKFKRQENPLTCEIAALRMSLNYLGIQVTESDLIYDITFSTKDPRTPDNVWGDPQKGFVGIVNGSIFKGTGYGVYNLPIKDLASKYATATTIENPDVKKILQHVKAGKPVIVWGLLSDKNPTYWTSLEGEVVEAFPGEHARIVIGYTGDISNPSNIILMDPLYGKIKMRTEQFIADWERMSYMSVIIS